MAISAFLFGTIVAGGGGAAVVVATFGGIEVLMLGVLVVMSVVWSSTVVGDLVFFWGDLDLAPPRNKPNTPAFFFLVSGEDFTGIWQ